ncbi:hypothetical protein D3C71_2056040 [compost metagenome]
MRRANATGTGAQRAPNSNKPLIAAPSSKALSSSHGQRRGSLGLAGTGADGWSATGSSSSSGGNATLAEAGPSGTSSTKRWLPSNTT